MADYLELCDRTKRELATHEAQAPTLAAAEREARERSDRQNGLFTLGESTKDERDRAARDADEAAAKAKANRDVVTLKRERLAEYEREYLVAQAKAALAEGDRRRRGLWQARFELLEALVVANAKRNSEYGWEVGLHQNGMERDRLADKVNFPGLRRGIVMFDGAYRPHVDRLTDEISKLCNELQLDITIVDGRVASSKSRLATAATAPAQPESESESALEGPDGEPEDDGDLDEAEGEEETP